MWQHLGHPCTQGNPLIKCWVMLQYLSFMLYYIRQHLKQIIKLARKTFPSKCPRDNSNDSVTILAPRTKWTYNTAAYKWIVYVQCGVKRWYQSRDFRVQLLSDQCQKNTLIIGVDYRLPLIQVMPIHEPTLKNFIAPNGSTKPRWVNILRPEQNFRQTTFSNAFCWKKTAFSFQFQWIV